MGLSEGLGDLNNLACALFRAEVNRGAYGRRAHVEGFFHGPEEHLVGLVRVRQELVVIDLDEERYLVCILSSDDAEYAVGTGNRVAATFEGEFDDALRVEIRGVLGEACTAGVLDALIYRKDGEVAGSAQAAGIEHPLKVAENAGIAITGGKNAVDKIGAGQVQRFLGNGLAYVLEQTVGLGS
jgi:hypothetical protein